MRPKKVEKLAHAGFVNRSAPAGPAARRWAPTPYFPFPRWTITKKVCPCWPRCKQVSASTLFSFPGTYISIKSTRLSVKWYLGEPSQKRYAPAGLAASWWAPAPYSPFLKRTCLSSLHDFLWNGTSVNHHKKGMLLLASQHAGARQHLILLPGTYIAIKYTRLSGKWYLGEPSQKRPPPGAHRQPRWATCHKKFNLRQALDNYQ